MPAHFDWQAEDERDWKEYGPAAAGRPDRRRRWAKVAGLTAVLLMLALAGAFQLRRFVDAAATAAEQEVQASHELLQRAVAESDLELLASLLLGRDADWSQVQLLLLDQGVLFDRPAYGLTRPAGEPPVSVEVTMAPDLDRAEVLAAYRYRLRSEAGVSETVTLKQTLIYGRERERWLLAAPDGEFWGRRLASNGRYLSATFYERDADIANRLAGDLEAALASACNALRGLACADDLHLDVQLAIDPTTLFDPSDQPIEPLAEGRIVLPTPTLLGLPADEGAYRALFRGYAARMLESLIGDAAGGECCPHQLQQALLDAQLRQLGLRAWPLASEDYRELFRQGIELEQLVLPDQGLARQDDAGRRVAYALVEFLFSQTRSLAPAEMQRLLAAGSSPELWLDEASSLANAVPSLPDAWQSFIRGRVTASQAAPPVAMPEQDVLVMCNDAQRGGTNLYRYSPAAGAWTLELGDRDFAVMEGLPGDTGALLTEQFIGADLLRTTVYQNGVESILSQGDIFYRSAGRQDPGGRYLAVVKEGAESSGAYAVSLLDSQSCSAAGCTLQPIGGTPVWSPGGSATILAAAAGADTLYLGGPLGESPRELGVGKEPFWLDDRTFGYLRGRPAPELVLTGLDGQGLADLITADWLAAGVDKGETPNLTLTHAIARPGDTPLIAVTAADRFANRDYLFVYDPGTRGATLALVLENTLDGLTPVEFSPDGRWLLAMGAGRREPDGLWSRELYLYQVADRRLMTLLASQARILPIQDWSADGRWLLQLGIGFLLLNAPDADYQHLVDHEFSNCTAAIWINPR